MENLQFLNLFNDTKTYKNVTQDGFSYSSECETVNIALLSQLQTTLDIEQILNIFSMEAAKLVSFVGLTLSYDDKTVKVPGSQIEKFEHSYPITVAGNLIAKLVYSTAFALKQNLSAKLEQLHEQLKYPLRNAIEFDRLKRMSLKDHLTGVGNRASFEDNYDRLLAHSERKKEPFTMMLFDLDNFKQVNDDFGHERGDRILQSFARVLTHCLRNTDLIFRFGGDEFVALLDHSDSASAELVAKRIMTAINKDPIMSNNGVTSSIGYAQWRQGDDDKSLFVRADRALYMAKAAGRDCVKTA